MSSDSPVSPCIGVCQLNEDDECVGCGRTLAEIARWSQLTPDQRRMVYEEARARLANARKNSSSG